MEAWQWRCSSPSAHFWGSQSCFKTRCGSQNFSQIFSVCQLSISVHGLCMTHPDQVLKLPQLTPRNCRGAKVVLWSVSTLSQKDEPIDSFYSPHHITPGEGYILDGMLNWKIQTVRYKVCILIDAASARLLSSRSGVPSLCERLNFFTWVSSLFPSRGGQFVLMLQPGASWRPQQGTTKGV